MRVTEGRMIELAATATSRARDAVARAGQELSSGLEIQQASDDPVRWAAGKLAQARTTIADGHARSIDRARGRLTEADSALDDIGSVLSRGRELAIQMANGHMSATERSNAAAEVAQLRTTMLGLADRRGGDGEYLLAGAGGTVAPFDAAGSFVGTADERVVVTGEGQTQVAGLSGVRLTAASGVDVAATLDALASALALDDQAGVQAVLDPLGDAIDQVASARTTVGVRMSALDVADEARLALEGSLAAELDRAVAADPIAAASRLSHAASSLEVAKAAAARIAALLSQR